MKLGSKIVENALEFLKSFPVYRKVQDVNEYGDTIEKTEQLTYEEAIQPVNGATPDMFINLGNPVAGFNYTDKFDAIDRLTSAIDSINIESDEEE